METLPDVPISSTDAPAAQAPLRIWTKPAWMKRLARLKKPSWLKKPGPLPVLWSMIAVMTAALIWYSQTDAFAWDEGFHLLAAQLIAHGKRPYLDFFFPQAPLNAYWNALWMKWLGEGWRASHLVAAVMTMGAVALIGDLIYRRFPDRIWRTALVVTGTAFIGANTQLLDFGPIGQGYALALFLSVLGMRLTMAAAGHKNPALAGLAGMAAVGAAGATLLVAPAAPVFLLWLLIFNRTGARWLKAAAFVLGGLVSVIPEYLLWRQGPEQVIFGIFKYHMFYREVDWDGALRHDIGQLTSFYVSVTAFLLGVLAIAGFCIVVAETWRDRRATLHTDPDEAVPPANRLRRAWQWLVAAIRRSLPLPMAGSSANGPGTDVWAFRAELYLCAAWAIAETIHVFRAHPTFARYLIFCVPGMTLLAVRALTPVGSRLARPDKPWWIAAPLVAVLFLGAGKEAFENRTEMHWDQMDKMGAKVNEVVPRNQRLLADEHIYLTAPHDPPSGMESRDSHKLKLPPDLAQKLHVVNKEDINDQVQHGKFFAVATCEDDDEIEDKDLPRLFAKEVDVDDCKLFWQPVPRPEAAKGDTSTLPKIAKNVSGSGSSKAVKH
jgi:hypothetical protein